MQSVVLMHSDTLTIWAGEGSNLLAVHSTKDVFVPIDGIQERNFAPVALVERLTIVQYLVFNGCE